MNKDNILSVIIITNNDERIISDRLTEITKTVSALNINYEILIVDNNSKDNTVKIIHRSFNQNPHTRVLILSKKYDTGIAITAGLDSCIGDYAIVLNIYTDPPIIISLITAIIDKYDVIIGKHTNEIRKRSIYSSLFLQLVNKISKHEFRSKNNYTLGLNRKAINSITRIRRKNRNFEYLGSQIGLRQYTLNFKPILKFKKKVQKENVFELFSYISNASISHSFKPIRIISIMGSFLSFIFLLYVLCVGILDVIFGLTLAPKGWISLGTFIATLFFILFILLLIMSEYLVRIITETRDEPFYFVSDEINKSIILKNTKKLNIE